MMTRKKWRDMAPMKTEDRLKMDQKDPWCFLDHSDPNRPKYPVCPSGSDKPTCQGVEAALRRARMTHNQAVVTKAEALKAKMNCPSGKKTIVKKELQRKSTRKSTRKLRK